MTLRTSTIALLALCVLMLPASAQQPVFTVNGHTDATVALGAQTEFRVDSNPGALVNILLNIDDGPSDFLGMPMPIALDANLVVSHIGVPVDPAGVFVDLINVPVVPGLEGFVLYAVCITNDATLPTTFGLSNGVSMNFSRAPQAGADTAGLVGEPITLDGTANAATPLQTGQALSWYVESGPAGHNATLAGADTLLPTLTADVAGTYAVRLEIIQPGTTGGNFDEVLVDVHAFQVTSHTQGEFSTADPLMVAANISGPAGASLSAPGLGSGGTSVSGSVAAGAPFTHVPFEIVSAGGQKSGAGLTIVDNAGAPFATSPLDSFGIALRQPLLTDVETALEAALALVDLSGPLTGVPPIPVLDIPGPFNTTLFSADVTLTALSYDPNIDVTLSFVPGATHVQMTINMVQLDFDVAGLLFNAPYTDHGVLTMTSLVLDFDVTTTASGAQFVSMSSNENATINGAALMFTGGTIPNSFASQLLGAVVPAFEGVAAQLLPPLVVPAIDALFAALPQQVDLAPALDMTLDFIPGQAVHSAGGLTLLTDGSANATVIDPNAPQPGAWFATPSAPPVFGANVPGTSTPYDLALTLADDLLNQTVAAALTTGALSQDISGTIDVGGVPVQSDAGSWAMLFPNLGFEGLDPATPIHVVVKPQVAPVIEISNGPDQLTVDYSDVVVDLQAELSPAHRASIVRLGLGGATGLSVKVNAMTGTLDILPGMSSTTAHAIATLPGVDATPQLSALTSLIDLVLPGLLAGIGSIPIPNPGTGAPLVPVGILADGPAGDYLSIFLD